MAGLFRIVLEVSITAGVISLMSLGARLLMGRRSGALLPLLTVLIIARLAIPFSISSPLSIQNLLPRIELPAGAESALPEEIMLQGPADTAAENASGQSIIPANESITVEADAAPQATDICAVVWLIGMAALAAFIAAGNARFASRIRRNRKYDAQGFEELLLRCRAEMGLRRNVEAVQMSEINTAAVYGTFRPRLLISPSFAWLSEEEKRHVLLHELAHIKRGDSLFSLLITALNVVYWFNPLVWAALALARRDIEVMCDMAVLGKTEDRKGYARTLLGLAKAAPANRPRLAALFVSPQRFGVLVSTNSIKRRIKMIAGYKKNPVMTALALILTAAIAVTGCTVAASPEEKASEPPQVTQRQGMETETKAKYNGTYTLKDKSLSVSIPKGWAAKDITDDTGVLSISDPDMQIRISSMGITGSPQITEPLRESLYFSTSIAAKEIEGQVFTAELETLASRPASTKGLEGMIVELRASYENGEELRGLCAEYVGTEKYYSCSMVSSKEDFNSYEQLFYDLLETLDFEPDN